jgi:endo-1,4-beta-mannosidase
MHFKDGYQIIDGKKQFVLGINYLSSSKGHSVNFWRHPDLKEIDADLKHIASLKFTAVRLSLPFDLIDPQGNEDKELFQNIDKIIDLCGKHNLKVVLTFFHTASFLEDPAVSRPEWTKPENFYSSESSFEFITKYTTILIKKYGFDDRMLSWDIGNEPWWHAGIPPNRPEKKILTAYSKKMFALVRKLGAKHPLTFGADHSPILQELGADIIEIAEDSDFVSTHYYSKYVMDGLRLDTINSFRDTHYGPYILKFGRHGNKPMGCYEFGNSTLQVTEAEQAAYNKVLLYSCFVAGSNSMFPWTYCDMDLSVRHIYNNYCQQELEFGIVRADRSPKKTVAVFEEFADVIGKIDLDTYAFAKPEAAIYVEKGFYDRLYMNSAMYPNAYMMARAANIPVNFVRHDEDLTQYKLLFVPNGILTIEEMDKIGEFIHQGGTVFMSFNKHIHGMASGYMQDIFGFKQKDFLRLPNDFEIELAGEPEKMHFNNMELIFRAGGGIHPNMFFVVEPAAARVIASDNQNRPAMCINSYGKGTAISCMFPVEQCMAQIDFSFHHIKSYALYAEALKHSGIQMEVRHQNPFVETGIMQGNNNTALLFLINHESSSQKIDLTINKRYTACRDFLSSKPISDSIEMQPNEVKLLKLL